MMPVPTGAVLMAGALAAGAVACWLPGRTGRADRPAGPPPRAVLLLGLAVVAVVAARSATDRPQILVLLAIAGSAGAAAVALLRRHREQRRAATTRRLVVELCDGLQAELAAGQTPIAALQRAAGEWPLLGAATRTADSGGDVPSVLRDAAAAPGAGDLRIVAAAWQIAHRTGHGLGDAVARVATELRAAEHTRRVVAGELASARATARLVAALPLAALLMGSGAGADPWSFLLGEPLGLACLAAGLGCGLAGLAWIEALARDVERGR